MDIFLPIAEMTVNAPLMIILGAIVGFISGMFGVGGGFLMTPMLIFLGVPPSFAVGSQTNQIVGSSMSGMMTYWRKQSIDFKIAAILQIGSLVGTAFGVWCFNLLSRLGQLDLTIALMYVVILGIIGILMMREAVTTMIRNALSHGKVQTNQRKHKQHNFFCRLPGKMRFPKSGLYISVVPIIMVGTFGGFMVAMMGVGGGFFLVPCMVFFLGMPTHLTAGTSLFQIIISTAIATILQAGSTHSVDLTLALLILLGGASGAPFGAHFAGKLRGEHLRAILSLMILTVVGKLLFDLLSTPLHFYATGSGGLDAL